MKPLSLSDVAGEFEMIDGETHLFYNTETGEFDFYNEFVGIGAEDPERFEDGCWVSAPSQRDIGEYDMMVEYAETVTDPHANELLCVALEGKGAFWRFKNTLHRIGLVEDWFAYKRSAYIDL